MYDDSKHTSNQSCYASLLEGYFICTTVFHIILCARVSMPHTTITKSNFDGF